MKKTNKLFWAGLVLLASFGLASANHRVIVVTWCGDAGAGEDQLFWNDLCLNDSVSRTVLHVDTIVNLFYDGTFKRGETKLHYMPKYKTSFVDGPASLAQLDSLTSFLARTMDSTDILYVMVQGHGAYESIPGKPGYHSDVAAFGYPGDLTDSIMAADFNRIHAACKIFVFNPCETDGNGRSPDSSGFLTRLGYHNPDSVSTIVLSGAGLQPAWSTMKCDDGYKSGDTIIYIDSLENEWYDGSHYDHSEFSFHWLTSLWGGKDPSEYYARRGISFLDSIDVNPHDGQISVAEAFAWAHHRDTQLGWENSLMLDLGHLADSIRVWPTIGRIESTGIQEPRVTLPIASSPFPSQTIMSGASFSAWLARHSDFRVYDMSGRQASLNQARPGVYVVRAKTGVTRKVILTD